jgi:hypothetical protein
MKNYTHKNRKGGKFGESFRNFTSKVYNSASTAKQNIKTSVNSGVSNLSNTAKNVYNNPGQSLKKAASYTKNKASYAATLALNTSNVERIHLKHQFYVQYLDISSVMYVYGKNENGVRIPREDIEISQSAFPFDYNYYIHYKTQKVATPSIDGVVEENVEGEKEAEAAENNQKIQDQYKKAQITKSTKTTATVSKISFGRIVLQY